MTPTSESERREVAATLREFADTDIWASKMISVWEKFGDTDRLSADILADLIDPTCHVVSFDEESMWLPHCSRCGQPILKPWPNHCPNCGARVVADYGK